ncbi:MAG: SGNH/GDSL hydrolase family protein [Aquihabitans sp.]
MHRAHRLRRGSSLVVAIVVAVTAATSLTACEPAADTYVAMGDSFVSGPLIPSQSGGGCMRSSRNYPNVARTKIKATKFTDISCSGAKVDDFFNANGNNPPQLSALNNDTKIVTVGISGNDIGFTEIIKTCALQEPWGSGCKGDYVKNGRDELSERITVTGPRLAVALAYVKQKAPRAKIFVTGYPTVLPATGSGCYPAVPILPVDVKYLRSKFLELNSMIKSRTQAAGGTYIDLATPSVGHDFCALDKWVEGIVPLAVAAPVHPNQKGMAAFGNVVATEINKVVTK